MRYYSLHEGSMERHLRNAQRHMAEGNSEYAAGSMRKLRKFALRHYELEAMKGGVYGFPIAHEIDLGQFNKWFADFLVANVLLVNKR